MTLKSRLSLEKQPHILDPVTILTATSLSFITRDHSFPRQILPNSAAPFAKFRGSPRQILGIRRLTAAAHFRVTVPTMTQL